jgi:hypothetical protein
MEEIPEHTELCESKLKNLREFYGETKWRHLYSFLKKTV